MDLDIDVPAVLAGIADLGVRVALDDFGTGHSSLAHLRDFPLHEIKIDLSFVARIGESASDRAVIRAVLAIATQFGAIVVVEGIEEEQQRQAILAMQDDVIAQGYHFARPMPARELTDLLREGARLPVPEAKPSFT
jgi:EAL domain-containing protein (putative c-di-GMP-specific phosphodiesterase class I)